jgi:predicted nucleotidyltransferase
VTDFERLLRTLDRGGVEFVLVGGLAANAHGAIRTTRDVDVVYARTIDNYRRLTQALAPLAPYLRGAPPGLPFRLDEPTLAAGLNFTLTTTAGELDLLGEVAGAGTYQALIATSRQLELFGTRCWCVDLETLIRLKQAAGRPKDFEALAELIALKEERDRQQG